MSININEFKNDLSKLFIIHLEQVKNLIAKK